jgi:hypothetical protein
MVELYQNHLLICIIWQIHTSLRPQLQAILSATTDAYPDSAQRLIPLLLASPENSFSRKQLNDFIRENEQLPNHFVAEQTRHNGNDARKYY